MSRMITIVGTAHVFDLSSVITQILEEKQPEIICVELDNQRYQALLRKHLDLEKSRGISLLYKLLASVQEKLAREYGVTPGEEMLTAIRYAERHQLPISLIDMDAKKIFTRLLEEMSFREKLRLALSGILGFLIGRRQVEKELELIEGDIDRFMREMNKKFPTVKRILVDERNQFMANKLVEVSKEYERIIAVVGEGHIPGLLRLLRDEDLEVEAIHLPEIRRMKLNGDPSTYSFTVNQEIPQHIDLKNSVE